MIIEIENVKGRKIGNIDTEKREVAGSIKVDEIFDDGYGEPIGVNIRVNSSSAFNTMNHKSCVTPIEQELDAYQALKKSYEQKNYYDCSVLINNYFGHIDYTLVLNLDKTHDEICLILYECLLSSLQNDNSRFIDFVDLMIGKIEWNLENR